MAIIIKNAKTGSRIIKFNDDENKELDELLKAMGRGGPLPKIKGKIFLTNRKR